MNRILLATLHSDALRQPDRGLGRVAMCACERTYWFSGVEFANGDIASEDIASEHIGSKGAKWLNSEQLIGGGRATRTYRGNNVSTSHPRS